MDPIKEKELFDRNPDGKNEFRFVQKRLGHAVDRIRRENNMSRKELSSLLLVSGSKLDRMKIGKDKETGLHIYDWSKFNFSLTALTSLANDLNMQFVEFFHYIMHGEHIKTDEEMQLDALTMDFISELRKLRGIVRVRFLVGATAFLKMNTSEVIESFEKLFFLNEKQLKEKL